MLECIITFYSEEQATQVLDTAERWRKTKGAYPTIIQVPEEGYEIKRRVLADNLAKTDPYLLVDIGCVPAMPGFIECIEKRFDNQGMIELTARDSNKFSTGVRIIKKGLVTKWPEQKSTSYNNEHADAVRKAGKVVEMWPDVVYYKLGSKSTNQSKPN